MIKFFHEILHKFLHQLFKIALILRYPFTADNFHKFGQYNELGEEIDEREGVPVVRWAGKTHSALVSEGTQTSR